MKKYCLLGNPSSFFDFDTDAGSQPFLTSRISIGCLYFKIFKTKNRSLAIFTNIIIEGKVLENYFSKK